MSEPPGAASSKPEAAGSLRGLTEGRLFHRYPMLRLDRVLAVNPGQSARARVGPSANDVLTRSLPFYPAVMLIEAMAQVTALYAEGEGRSQSGTLAGLTDFEFREPVAFGRPVEVWSEHVGTWGRLVRTRAGVDVDGSTAAQGEITIAL